MANREQLPTLCNGKNKKNHYDLNNKRVWDRQQNFHKIKDRHFEQSKYMSIRRMHMPACFSLPPLSPYFCTKPASKE